MTSVSSSNSSNSSVSSDLLTKTGMGGLVSGMDIDSLVEQLTETSRAKIAKQNQKVQKLEWKQEAYREVTKALTEFQSKYLDTLSKTNLRSKSTFNTVVASSSSESISVSTNSGSYAGSFTVNSVTQLATAESYTGSAVSESVSGKVANSTLSSSDISTLTDKLFGKSIGITLDGTYRAVTFDNDFINEIVGDGTDQNWTEEDFTRALQKKLDTAFGATSDSDRVVTASLSGGTLSFDAPGSQITISSVDSDTDTLTALGLKSGQTNKIKVSTQLDQISFATKLSSTNVRTETAANGATSEISKFEFSINGIDFSFESNQSLQSIMETVNNSKAGVTLSYSTISDKFTLTSNTTGAGESITISQSTGNLLDVLGLNTASETNAPVRTAGKNAILTVDGQQIIRASNDISVNGVNISLNEVTSEEVKITMKEDASDLSEMIHSFVEDYNNVLSLMKEYTSAKSDSDYQPLTDEQKEEMSESEIEKWEEKAKSGILNNDSILNNITSKLQGIMYSTFDGYSLYSMGIATESFSSNGKLTIDEDKLSSALASDGAKIREMFSGENGIASRLHTVVQSAVKTSGAKGSRGTLVEAAGVESTMSDTQNSIYEEIQRINNYVKTLTSRLKDEQSRLWKQFTAMETALNKMNSQSSIISSFGQNSY
ncbi:MAG: flagellar filament capping protein FliD [Clostridia bacterium]|nr:flagellar filament capping protein FliD [Clostridia bacterium]